MIRVFTAVSANLAPRTMVILVIMVILDPLMLNFESLQVAALAPLVPTVAVLLHLVFLNTTGLCYSVCVVASLRPCHVGAGCATLTLYARKT